MSDVVTIGTTASPGPPAGPLELSVYKKDLNASRRFLRRLAAENARARAETGPPGKRSLGRSGSGPRRKQITTAFEAPTAGAVLARLLLARLFDRHPDALEELRSAGPVVLIDAPDPLLIADLSRQSADVLDLRGRLFVPFESLPDRGLRDGRFGLLLTTGQPASSSEISSLDAQALAAIQYPLPILAITPSADRHLPSILLDAASARLALPAIDPSLLERTIMIVTGARCEVRIPEDVSDMIEARDVVLAVRYDRAAQDCVDGLRRLRSRRRAKAFSAKELDRIATHEAGHAILAVLHNGPCGVHAVVGSPREGPSTVVSSGQNYFSGSADECRRSLQILLAGRAAEEITFADGGGNGVSGEDGDLAIATRIAAAMIGSYGHSGPHPLVYVADHHSTDKILAHRYMRMAAQEELSSALNESRRLLLRHRAALEAVAEILRQHGRIEGPEIGRILAGVPDGGAA